MIRSLKALGLSMVAALAFSAMIASAAQAEGKFVAEEYEQINATAGANPLALKMGNGARTIRCQNESLAAALVGPTETLTVTPAYAGECIATGNTPTTITQNGCTYTWVVVTKTTGTEAINCPAGAEINIRVYENTKRKEEGISLCEYGIPSHGPLSGLGFTNLGSGKTAYVSMSVNISSIPVNSFKGSLALCGIAGGTSGVFS